MSFEHNVVHTDGDFFQAQSFTLQLLSEGKISMPAFVLYCFYKSTAGFSQIKYSYEFISVNSGISKGAISKGLKQLEEAGLIQVTRFGANKTFDIQIIPGSNIPRRTLKQVERKGPLFEGYDNPNENFKAQQKFGVGFGKKKPELPADMKEDVSKKYDKKSNFDPSSLTPEAIDFWETFKLEWTKRSKTKFYPKTDVYHLADITDYNEAKKLIPVMWALGEHDKWTRESDHTLSVFVHLLKIGKLNNFYPNTSFYYKDKQDEDKIN